VSAFKKNNSLVQLRKIVDVDFKNQTKLLNAFCGHKAD
jgi:hypothetical protein